LSENPVTAVTKYQNGRATTYMKQTSFSLTVTVVTVARLMYFSVGRERQRPFGYQNHGAFSGNSPEGRYYRCLKAYYVLQQMKLLNMFRKKCSTLALQETELIP
jgi:hypothetical protein